MKTKKLLSTIAILFIALISGCASDDFSEVAGVCPVVSATIPNNGAFGVPLNQIISVNFNEEMNPETIDLSSIIITAGDVVIPGAISYSGLTATFTPSSRLTTNTLYTGKVTTAVKDVAGNALQTDYIWTFTTGLNPLVVSTDPANLAVDVSPNKIITATFNMSMNPATLNASTFTIKQGTTVIPGTITYAGTMVTFTPTTPLDENKIYTGTITKGAENTIGTELASDYVWTFTTGLRPIVISTIPANNAIGVPLNQAISATFNMPMNALTLIGTTFTVNQGTNPVLGIISYTGSTVSFTPSVPLAGNTVYTATITTDAKNLAGTALASNYVWTFTTISTVPVVVSTDPTNNATGVALNKVIRATFNIPMNPTTLNATTYTVKQGATTVLGTISYSGSTVSFTPTFPLEGNKIYTATITTGAQSVAGIAMASNYVWDFTTVVPVVIPPVAGLFFGVFGGNAGITNQGLFTVVNGSIGTTAASTLVTGFRDGLSGDVYTVTPLNDGLVTKGIYTDAPTPGSATKAATALAGLNAARDLYNSISPASMPGGVSNPGAGELGGLTLAPGIYTASSSFKITNGNLVLDAQGDSNAKWYFQAPSSLTVGDSQSSSVSFLGGVGNAANVYWYVGTAAVINYAGGGVMVGNIIANSGVTLSSPANSTNSSVTTLNGRAISLVASVTMVNTVINVPN
jgi:hypothetical protein